MRLRLAAAAGALVVGGSLAVSTPAFAACDAYSGVCPKPPTSTIGGGNGGPGTVTGTTTTPVTRTTAPTLPFTGAQLMLYVLVGGGAVAAGSVFVFAGRRRSEPAN